AVGQRRWSDEQAAAEVVQGELVWGGGGVGSGDGDSGGGSGVTRWWWRVKESGVGDRVDREVRKLFGFAGKSPPEKFFGGGWWPAGGMEVAGGWG
nr:hypothetical protein [Tanacetum cinerariifolium]